MGPPRDREHDAPPGGVDLVTGAFGNTGRAITALLCDRGRRVRTLTSQPVEDPTTIEALPFSDHADELAVAFQGVATFYNTYWQRTGGTDGYASAVARCTSLVEAATKAGVERIVHLSVAHASLDSPYPYFRGKARVEEALRATDTPVTVVRPALIFGGRSVLLNNLAWILRRSPLFAVPGDGCYRVRPVHVRDVARLCVEAGTDPPPTDRPFAVVDAVGPERPTFLDLVRRVRTATRGRARVVTAPPRLVLAAAKAIGAIERDAVLTAEELRSTMDGLADTTGPATGTISLGAWLDEHGPHLGHAYVAERRRA